MEDLMGSEANATVTRVTVTGSNFEKLTQGVMPAVTHLYVASDNLDDLLSRPKVAIVGSRKVSQYGQEVTYKFASELARAGVVIVSGLALGVDAIAHKAALEAGGLTIAVLPSSLQKIYPASHHNLAQQITNQGGALISEYEAGTRAYKNQFIERNRIVSGISDALLITEAAVTSGTMHTARYALEQGKEVLAVPGNITSPVSEGTNNLIKTGAAVATSVQDVFNTLGIAPAMARPAIKGENNAEQCILDLLCNDVSDGEELLIRSELPVTEFNQAFTMMEITGKVRALGANRWTVS